jgi:hypothetical protein
MLCAKLQFGLADSSFDQSSDRAYSFLTRIGLAFSGLTMLGYTLSPLHQSVCPVLVHKLTCLTCSLLVSRHFQYLVHLVPLSPLE